jgi:hypothetical protein
VQPSEAVYANEALYVNQGGDPVYSNVAEVHNFSSFLLFNSVVVSVNISC